jgi:hypothetical protein
MYNFTNCVKWRRLRQRYSWCWINPINNKKSCNSTFSLVCRTICCKLRFTNYISTIQPQDLSNETIPYQFISRLNNGACLNKTIQRLSRRRTWTFMFRCGYWYPGKNRTLSYTEFEFKDLVRDLNLSKIQAELLVSRLKGWNLLQQGVKVSGNAFNHCHHLFLRTAN